MHQQFIDTVWDFYRTNGRDLPWRQIADNGQIDPYKVMVSEVMLQQTQVPRVIPKYQSFLTEFPTSKALAKASLQSVLLQWQGLGYNRRGKFLREAAQMIDGAFPKTVSELVKLPGIGVNTASAILVYAYNQPLVFIETNIRTVYLHHFFPGQEAVSDKAILDLVQETIDTEHPREWYWALMDYGTYIKKEYGNANVRSKHYAKQSAFAGSNRQIRGKVLRLLSDGPISTERLRDEINDERLLKVLQDLEAEHLIIVSDDGYSIAP